jgi:DNA-binding response OmpR family regulator
MINILLVEDEEKLNEAVCKFLRKCGYNATGCLSANEAYDKMVDIKFDLIVSDIEMPEINGFKFVSAVRDCDKMIPILFMSVLDDFSAKQEGFRLGIDDYMVKPIKYEELQLRIEALLRRAKIANEKKLTAGSFTMNADETTAFLNGEEISLTLKEFQVLYKLLSYPGKAFTRIQIMDDVRGTETGITPRAVDVYITRLREKLAECKDFEILSVYGLGYKAVLK